MTFYLVLAVITLLLIIYIQTMLMIAATEYIYFTEAGYNKNKLSYIKFIKINFQKFIRSIYIKKKYKVSYLVFTTNLILLFLLSVPVVIAVIHSLGFEVGVSLGLFKELNSYYVLFATVLVFIARLINYILSSYKIDINKMILKGVLAIALIFLNFAFVNYYVFRLEKFFEYKLIIKLVLFFNTSVAIYIFDSFTKYKKRQSIFQIKLVDKISLYFILMGAFLLLNNNSVMNESFKYFYYSVSIFLIDFIVAYITKLFGYIKMHQTIKVSYEYIFIYYLFFYLLIFVVDYGI